ncbi:MAG TPA: hypothetical protein VHO69_11330 [Phototrophicaceae bacterium]|nr:hypothetical protein [Phototrophicaceae bacterium]
MLAFTGITQSNLQGNEVLGIAGVALGIALAMSLIGLGLSRMLGFERRLESAFLISIIMMNAANYGIPLNEFAFGPEGKQRAIIYYSMSVMIGSILGVFFASRGQATVKEAVMNVLKVPITYAVIAGLMVTLAGIPVPLPLERSINVLSQGSVPCMLAL